MYVISLEEDFHSNMIMNREGYSVKSTNSGWTSLYEEEVKKEINENSLEKWVSLLKRSLEVKYIEHYSEPEFTHMGYKKSSSKLSILEKITYYNKFITEALKTRILK